MKVVKAEEMARIEEIAYRSGACEHTFMENAGRAVADAAQDFLALHTLKNNVALLIGKGNNGGDALAAGCELLARSVHVSGYFLYPIETCSLLCQEMAKRFSQAGGTLKAFSGMLPEEHLILDGITGTGFHGKTEGIMLDAIGAANRSELPILAIDIPSGVDGNTGRVEGGAIKASQTLFLGLPKLGFFLEQGWEHVGDLKGANFGLAVEILKQAHAEAYLVEPDRIGPLLPPLQRTRHKYSRGYLLATAGSDNMPGAALLASLAALRAGAGMVRLFHLCEKTLQPPYEVITEHANPERILEEAKRAQALLIGPGLGRSSASKKLIKHLFHHSTLPAVVDADALYFLAANPSWKMQGGAVLTPHKGEMQRLLDGEIPDLARCQSYTEKHKITLVLKGAPTFIFQTGLPPLIISRGDPAMATAGAGDVLTGIIGSFLAQGLAPYEAAICGVYIHALAGESAAHELTSSCVIASDIISHLPSAFALFE